MKIEWWYNDAVFHDSSHTRLALARLSLLENGPAAVLSDGGEVIEFVNSAEALEWLIDEEYRRLDDLLQDLTDEGQPIDPRIALPGPALDEELVKHMVIDLSPGSPVPSVSSPDSLWGSPK